MLAQWFLRYLVSPLWRKLVVMEMVKYQPFFVRLCKINFRPVTAASFLCSAISAFLSNKNRSLESMKCFKTNECTIFLTLWHTEIDLCAFVVDINSIPNFPNFIRPSTEKRLVLLQRLNNLQINRPLLFQSSFLNFIIHIFQKYFVLLKAVMAKIDILHTKIW